MPDERDEAVPDACARCGMTIESAGFERAFAYGLTEVLCFECARALGGVYDAETEGWTVEPDVADLPDERR